MDKWPAEYRLGPEKRNLRATCPARGLGLSVQPGDTKKPKRKQTEHTNMRNGKRLEPQKTLQKHTKSNKTPWGRGEQLVTATPAKGTVTKQLGPPTDTVTHTHTHLLQNKKTKNALPTTRLVVEQAALSIASRTILRSWRNKKSKTPRARSQDIPGARQHIHLSPKTGITSEHPSCHLPCPWARTKRATRRRPA